MHGETINRVSRIGLVILPLIALFTVVSGYFQPPQTDEGAAAHIFQLAIVAFVPTFLIFLVTADWKQPFPKVRFLALPASVLAIAFAALFYLEHYR